MRYYVKASAAAQASVAVDIQELPSGELAVEIDGRSIRADVVALGRQLSIRVDGRVVDLTTEGTPPDIGVVTPRYRTYLRVESERQRAADAVKRGARGATENAIRAPMPGRIVKVLVSKGDRVVAGQPVLVMEAMKMENEIKTKADCTVEQIHVTVGVTVERGTKLVTLGVA